MRHCCVPPWLAGLAGWVFAITCYPEFTSDVRWWVVGGGCGRERGWWAAWVEGHGGRGYGARAVGQVVGVLEVGIGTHNGRDVVGHGEGRELQRRGSK